jgi:hypothetical protein
MQAPLPGAMAQGAPRPLVPMAPANAQAMNVPRLMQQPIYAPPVNSGVVMQPVPFDPYAGPVKSHSVAKLEPPKIEIAKPDLPKPADKIGTVKSPDAKPAPVKAAEAAEAKTADAKPVAKDRNGPAKPTAAKASIKDAVPALRLTADARNP